MENAKAAIAGVVFLVAHAWALTMLWNHAPAGREVLLVAVYALILVGSAITTKRLIPPLVPSLVPFAVVLIWRLLFV